MLKAQGGKHSTAAICTRLEINSWQQQRSNYRQESGASFGSPLFLWKQSNFREVTGLMLRKNANSRLQCSSEPHHTNTEPRISLLLFYSHLLAGTGSQENTSIAARDLHFGCPLYTNKQEQAHFQSRKPGSSQTASAA